MNNEICCECGSKKDILSEKETLSGDLRYCKNCWQNALMLEEMEGNPI